jgi:hypothetical protein
LCIDLFSFLFLDHSDYPFLPFSFASTSSLLSPFTFQTSKFFSFLLSIHIQASRPHNLCVGRDVVISLCVGVCYSTELTRRQTSGVHSLLTLPPSSVWSM